MSNFTEYDIVRYDTGTTYMVLTVDGPETLCVKGWKNGKPFGAIRFIDPARCELIGRTARRKTSADKWGFEPIS